jgi:hypothetical protein
MRSLSRPAYAEGGYGAPDAAEIVVRETLDMNYEMAVIR